MSDTEKGNPPARGGLNVRDTANRQRPFLRGMVTHSLVRRGLSFDEAYAAAQAIRESLRDRSEITTDELGEIVEAKLSEILSPEKRAALAQRYRAKSGIRVVAPGETSQPFSRGVLAHSIYAAGVDLDRAYRLIALMEEELRAAGVTELASQDLARRVGDLLERDEGADSAAQYRLVRSIQRLPRPLIIYLGGASGTGKSTLALDLAPLLKIYRINATDSIRQLMRLVFSPVMMPAIHRSSFEEIASGEKPFSEDSGGGLGDAEGDHKHTATFEEQAQRVCVGVRAVVDRAIKENMSIIVEGVHLVPPLVPFPDLEGAAYQLPLILTTLDEESHRARFLTRSRTGHRRAERYLDAFARIRSVQEFILQQADLHDVPMLDTADRETNVARSLRLLTGVLQHRVPQSLLSPSAELAPSAPALLLILDGAPDRPLRALGGRTPLQAANTPNLDRLAREGICGLADPVAPGVVPDTASGNLSVFGQSPRAMKRGAVEAVGAGFQLRAGDIALRGNFATLDEKGWVLDRRAGRIREGADELAKSLNQISAASDLFEDVEIRVRVTTEHRLAVVMSGDGLSSAIDGSDPGDGSPPGPTLVPRPIDPADERAENTARVLALFEQEARRVLQRHPVNLRRIEQGLPPANSIVTRGAGRVHELFPLERSGLPLRVACVSGDSTVLGLAKRMGVRPLAGPSMTANLDTDLEAKFRAARDALQNHDLVFLHVKGADIAAHDRRSDLKVDFLERVDERLGWLLDELTEPIRIAVASDHATISEVGQHGADPVPVLIWGLGIEADTVSAFDERSVGAGSLQRFPLQLLVGRVLEFS